MAGLIKTVLALRHRQIPPTPALREAEPEDRLRREPVLRQHRGARRGPSRAGHAGPASALRRRRHERARRARGGAGRAGRPRPARPRQLLVLSARTAARSRGVTASLARSPARRPRIAPRRRRLHAPDGPPRVRRTAAPSSRATRRGAIARSRDPAPRLCRGARPRARAPRSPSCSPARARSTRHGPRALRARAGVPGRRSTAAPSILRRYLGLDLASCSTRPGAGGARPPSGSPRPRYAQPALFAVEYALARLLARRWGLSPGRCSATASASSSPPALAGVFSLEDALRLVAARGRLMQEQPAARC